MRLTNLITDRIFTNCLQEMRIIGGDTVKRDGLNVKVEESRRNLGQVELEEEEVL